VRLEFCTFLHLNLHWNYSLWNFHKGCSHNRMTFLESLPHFWCKYWWFNGSYGCFRTLAWVLASFWGFRVLGKNTLMFRIYDELQNFLTHVENLFLNQILKKLSFIVVVWCVVVKCEECDGEMCLAGEHVSILSSCLLFLWSNYALH